MKTPHKPIKVDNTIDGETYIYWICMDCQNGYHKGNLEFTSQKQGTITKDEKTKNQINSINLKTQNYGK